MNGWIRSVAERLAREGYAALSTRLFSRTAPLLDLAYNKVSLRIRAPRKIDLPPTIDKAGAG